MLWALVNPKPDHRLPRAEYRYFQGGAQVPEHVAVNVRNRSHRLVVDLTIAARPTLTACCSPSGRALGGWSLHILDGRLRYVHNLYGKERHVVESAELITPGEHHIEYDFTKDAGLGGTGGLRCDGIRTRPNRRPRNTGR